MVLLAPSYQNRLSGSDTVKNWEKLRTKLRRNPKKLKHWKKAYDFLAKRLETRYLKPIRDIRKQGDYNGEGFAIMTLLCSLIEFLEATWQGKVYRHYKDLNEGEALKSYEYSNSSRMFTDFLCKKPPFAAVFSRASERKSALAKDFYVKLRCSLLHHASTEGKWLIRVDNENCFYEEREGWRVIDRNKFEKAMKTYLKWYKQQLFHQPKVQEAFIRKMNSLAQVEIEA